MGVVETRAMLFVCTLLLTYDTFTDYIVNKVINRNNIQLLPYVPTLQRYNSFFNVQIFWEKFLVRDREIDLLNSILVSIFCPKKALKKGDRLAKQHMCLYFLPPKKPQKRGIDLLNSKRVSVFLCLYGL